MSTRGTCPDGTALVSLLYEDFEPDARPTRDEVVRHLRQCTRCSEEFEALGGVREQLAAWTDPAAVPGFEVVPTRAVAHGWRDWVRAPASRGRPWGVLPLAAAATIVLGASLGLARLDIRYDAGGLQVRTGWGHPDDARAAQPLLTPVSATPRELEAVKQALAALDGKLASFEATASRSAAAPVAASAPAPASDTALLRRIQALIEESEVRQQQNLQLRIGEIARDFELQRRADLVQIEQGFGRIDSQRQQMLNMMRQVSTTQVPQR
jgi:hypothetical protein